MNSHRLIEASDPIECNTLKEAKQTAFEIVVRGLASQNWHRCYNFEQYMCQWNLGFPGFHCAIGWMIPWENQYGVASEAQTASQSLGLLHPALAKFKDAWPSENFLIELQRAHDQNGPDMNVRVWVVGEENNLTWPADVEKPSFANL